MLRQAASRLVTRTAVRQYGAKPTFASSSRHFSAGPSESSEDENVSPEEVFHAIDTNNDGVLQKDEFLRAVDMLNYTDLLKIKKSLARNELSYETEHKGTDEADSFGSLMARRVQVTAEVAVSKIFPAGFGWQTAASLAEGAGMNDANLDFALATGLGDGFAVFAGHTLYMTGKKAIADPTIDITTQAQTGILLGSAAVCSGGIWQPFVNALQAAGWSFNASVLATTGACSLAFFTGLRLGRGVYGRAFEGVEEATYANLKADAALSVAVGGAAGCFVGTDVSYEAANWMRPVLGVEETASATTASILAGSSTAVGFTVVQMGENVVYPKNKCWVD